MTRPANPNARLALLRAAEHEFVARGLDAAKIEAITATAGMSKGAFYLHFDSKEDAFRQIVEGILAPLQTLIEDFPRPSSFAGVDDYFEQWIQQDIALYEYIWQHRNVMRLLLDGGKSAVFSHLPDAFAERARQASLLGIAEGKQRGFFHADLDVELASLFLAGAYDRVARHMVKLQKRPNLAVWMRTLQRFVVEGLGGPAVVAARKSKAKTKSPPPSQTNDPSIRPRTRVRTRRSA